MSENQILLKENNKIFNKIQNKIDPRTKQAILRQINKTHLSTIRKVNRKLIELQDLIKKPLVSNIPKPTIISFKSVKEVKEQEEKQKIELATQERIKKENERKQAIKQLLKNDKSISKNIKNVINNIIVAEQDPQYLSIKKDKQKKQIMLLLQNDRKLTKNIKKAIMIALYPDEIPNQQYIDMTPSQRYKLMIKTRIQYNQDDLDLAGIPYFTVEDFYNTAKEYRQFNYGINTYNFLDITIFLYSKLKLNNNKKYKFIMFLNLSNNRSDTPFDFKAPKGKNQFFSYMGTKQYFNFYKDSNTPYMIEGSRCYYIEEDKIESIKHLQSFRDSNDITEHCFLDPIIYWAEDCLKKTKSETAQKRYKTIINKINKNWKLKFASGFDESEIMNFCNDIDINITVEYPLGYNKLNMLEYKSNNKSLKHFKFINTRFNHVDIDFNKTVVTESNLYKPEMIETKEEMQKIKDELDDKNIFNQYMEYKGEISFIKTADNIYKLNSEENNIISEFELKNGINAYKLDYIKNENLCKFIESGNHCNVTAQLIENDKNNIDKFDYKKHIIVSPKKYNWKLLDMIQDNEIIQEQVEEPKEEIYEEITNLDQEKAYTQFKLCPEYMGFIGKVTDFRECTDVKFALKNNGYYKINNIVLSKNIKEINDKMEIFINDNTYTSPELNFLNNNGCSFSVVCGCWGTSFDFEFNDDMKNKYNGVSCYAKWTGRCMSVNLNTSFMMKGQKEFFENMRFYNPQLEISMYNGYAEISYKKNHVGFKGHISGYITAYQRLNMLYQLLNMDLSKVIRIVTDGIYHYQHNFNINNSFRFKEVETTVFYPLQTNYITNINIIEYEEPKGHFLEHNMKALYIGPGGTGKTHLNLMDNGYINKLYIAPSWKLATNKKNEYSMDSTVLARTINSEECVNIYNNFNVLIFDECSQYTQNDKDKIFKVYNKHKIIMCGDIGYQLPPAINEVMNIHNFDYTKEFKEVFRFKCNKLKKMCEFMRSEIKKINDTKDEAEKRILSRNLTTNIILKNEERVIQIDNVENLYCVEDFILVSKNKCNKHHLFECNCDNKNYAFEYNEMLKNKGDKFIVKKNSNDYNNGDIVFDKNIKNTIPAHAFSIHSIQGETIESKIFIDCRNMFEPQMLYTAISRARKIEQLYFID